VQREEESEKSGSIKEGGKRDGKERMIWARYTRLAFQGLLCGIAVGYMDGLSQ
jgi:hypothetical protein